ncbi:MAG: hypothetical protein D6761_09310 [Candidatus Dadabacteria bacterium]|nr:MAG: hypothetical protein D6761_09310 [Candidatus Dadabacteria bacterium]
MLKATLDASELVIEFQTPPLSADRIRLEIDATVENEPQAREIVEIDRGEQINRDVDGLLIDLSFDDAGLRGYLRRAGAFHLTDHDTFTEGAQGNVSVEVFDAASSKRLTHLTILAIGPAPRTTGTQIRGADEPLHAPAGAG